MSTELPPAEAESPEAGGVIVVEERPHPLTPVVQVWVWLVALVIFGGRQLLENPDQLSKFDPTKFSWPLIVVLGLGGVSIAWNLWTWWTTRFVVTDAELRVEHRGVQHESRRVAYRRIQAVDITQPFAARLLGMAELAIDVGGDSSVRLRYLSRQRATELRAFLLERAHGPRNSRRPTAWPAPAADTPAAEDGTAGSEPPDEWTRPAVPDGGAAAAVTAGGTQATSAHTRAWDDAAASDLTLIRVPPGQLALGAVLSHELLVLILLGLIPIGIGVATGHAWLIGGGLIPILLSIAGFLSSRVIGQFNFTLADTGTGLRITRGLTSITSQTLPVHRVQAIRIDEPVLWRRVRRARIELTTLGLAQVSADEGGVSATSVMLPIGSWADVKTAVSALWPGVDVDAVELRQPPRRARWLAPLAWRWIGYGWSDRVLVLRRGWWTRQTWVIPHARLQSARARSGPLERHLRLATAEVHPAGISMPASVYLEGEHAADFVFAEMRRAREARAIEHHDQTSAEASKIGGVQADAMPEAR